MANNYPYYTAPQFYQPMRYPATEQTQPQIKGRPVTSIEEVRATTIDFDGSIFYFPDLANKRIYTKQINFDGTSTINVYELLPIPNNSNPQYVTRNEFDNLIAQLHERFAGTQLQSATKQASSQNEAATLAVEKKASAPSTPARPQFDF